MPGKPPTFTDAADVVEKLTYAAVRMKETDILTGVSLRDVIPLTDALVVLAREIEELKSRLPPPHASNGKPKPKKKP
jgi:hypothetical protein